MSLGRPRQGVCYSMRVLSYRLLSRVIVLSSGSLALTGCPEKMGAVPTTSASAVVTSAAAVGKPAPDFTLKDLDGALVKLGALRGKTVVLEWFNPGCPFVKQAHKAGSLARMAADQTAKGVVWIAVNSSAPGNQGHGLEGNKAATKEWSMSHQVVLDESGDVGRAYGAQRTPQMFVIDPEGSIVYRGAIDSSKGGEPEPGDKVVNHVEAALADLAAKRPVAVAETEPFGCTVKYRK